MVLKNLIKARKGHAEPLSENAQLVDSGLLTGFEALPTVEVVLLPLARVPPGATSTVLPLIDPLTTRVLPALTVVAPV